MDQSVTFVNGSIEKCLQEYLKLGRQILVVLKQRAEIFPIMRFG